MDSESYLKPKWMGLFTDIVRPGGVALMFFFITILPLIFALLELGFHGTGTILAGVLSGYFKAIPDVYYTTLQVLFLGYVAGKSAEVVAGKVNEGKVIMANKMTSGDLAAEREAARGTDA